MAKLFLYLLCLPCIVFASINTPLRDPFIDVTVNFSKKINTLHTAWIPLYFAHANIAAEFIKTNASGLLSPQGTVQFDERNNQLWIQDDQSHLMRITAVLRHLDQPAPQFLIKARILNIDRQYQKSLGILFHTQQSLTSTNTSLNMDMPTNTNDTGQFTISIAKLAQNQLLNLQISALEKEGHAFLVSSPSLVTLNRKPAIIESGSEIPYEEATSSGATSISFKKAVLRLKVTPQRMPNQHILLHIELNQDKVSALTVKGVPAIETQKITTQVVVKNNQTIVLGGILEITRANQAQGIPVLKKMPIVGQLFSHHTQRQEQQELLIFITPSVMQIG